MIKDFEGWGTLKTQINIRKDAPTFQQQEIWWCSIGVNIGNEEDGKSRLYSRPVLVVRKFNQYMFWGLPLTTKIKDNAFYHQIHFKDLQQSVMLSHLKLIDSKRLTSKMGKLSDSQFEDIKTAIKKLI